jgi:cytochrome c oxidase cbb3-type subunit 3
MFLSVSVMAQTNNAAQSTNTGGNIDGITPTAFYSLIGVIAAEVLVIFFLLFFLRGFITREKIKVPATARRVKPIVSVWEKFNSLRPIHEETNIDLGHNYDGIRELDNRLPPWWLYGFYITILFAGIYLWRYHVAHSAPLSGEEYTIAMQKAEAEKAEYMKKAANLVDETNVKLLTDANSLAEGKKIFNNPAFCTACHKSDGGGLVGPNLTDDYWIYGGGIKDIFKTIKYGTNKGMKSWKDDLSPLQIAQVASYIKSLYGSKPKDAKAPQGDFYQESAPEKTDSASTNKKTTASIN